MRERQLAEQMLLIRSDCIVNVGIVVHIQLRFSDAPYFIVPTTSELQQKRRVLTAKPHVQSKPTTPS